MKGSKWIIVGMAMDGLGTDGFERLPHVWASGVYALVRSERVIYIGKATNIHSRIGHHISNMKSYQKGVATFAMKTRRKFFVFDDIWFMPVPVEKLDQAEREMIRKYQPKYNIVLRVDPDMTIDLVALGLAKPVAQVLRRV